MKPIAAFFGASLAAALPAGPFTQLDFDPADARVTLTFSADGTYTATNFSGGTIGSGTWLIGGGTSADYTIRCDPTSGTLTSGSTGSDLAFPQTFRVTQTTVGVKSCTADYTIKSAAGATLATRSIKLEAEVSL